jgi:CspA family cold shock protein
VRILEGKVKKWLEFRGFGFIEIEGRNEDVFVHHSELNNTSTLKSGQKVEFEIEDSPKGPKALNVKEIV